MLSRGAYGPWDARQQRAATIVYDADDIRRVVTKCTLAGTPCNLVLGDNIIAASGFTFPSGLPSLTVNGGGLYKFHAAGVIDTMFKCGCPAYFHNITVQIDAAGSITTLFEAPSAVVDPSKILVVEDVAVHPFVTHSGIGGGLTNVFGSAGQSIVFARRVNLYSGDNMFRENATTPESYSGGSFVDFAGLTPLQIGTAGGTTGFSGCVFDGIAVCGGIRINGGSGNVFSRFPSTMTITNNLTTGNTFIEMFPAGITTLSKADVWLSRRTTTGAPGAILINSAGPTLTPTVVEDFIRVTHGASASGNVTIAAGRDGQRLTLYFVSVAGTAAYTDGSGNLELASNFTPTAADTLSLIYDATTAKWVELCRSVN